LKPSIPLIASRQVSLSSTRSILTLAILAALSPAIWAAEGVSLRLERSLQESNADQKQGRPVFGQGDNVEGRTDKETTFVGNGELRKAGSVLKGDRITYYSEDDEVVAVGNVRLTREGNVFTGPQLQLKLDANSGSFTNPEFALPLFSGRGRAEKVDFLGPKQAQFSRAVYTTCPPDQVDWFITTDRLLIDEDTQAGSGQRATLYFKDRKIVTVPNFSFPLGDGRRSGFLPPTYGVTSSAGLDLIVPYYFDIAPNRDLTLYPRIMLKRGIQLGSHFRYLEDERSGDLKLEVNPNDRQTGTRRYYGSLSHVENDVLGWRGTVTLRGVSDANYFIDHARTILYSAERSLPRDVLLTRSISDWNLIIRASKYQNILENAATPPYERVPQLTANTIRRDVAGFDVAQLFDATTFRRPLPNQPEGSRLVSATSISYPITRPGWFIRPKVSLHMTDYHLDKTSWDQGLGGAIVTLPTHLSRVVPTLSLDGGLIFERDTNIFNRDVRQTLEPRMFYVRTPYRNQNQFPVFDTAVADFNFSQLFTENTFVGNDRIANANQLTVAAVTRLINPNQGSEFLRFALGQRLYFSDQRVLIPGTTARVDRRSDILLAAGGEIAKGLTFDAGMQYSLDSGAVPRFSFLSRYLPRDGHIFNLAVRYQKDSVGLIDTSFGQLDTSWQWPVTQKISALGRVNYTFLGKRDTGGGNYVDARGVVESVVGFEFKECCWLARAVLQRFTTAPGKQTSTFFLQLELNGLGKVGSDPFEVLRRSIPGYRLPSDRQVSPSNYFGYE
jgi:LPS-assembly protein